VNEVASDLPARSPNGAAALDIFYADFNDVNFYVEDEQQENLYQEIFRKLFHRIRITRIFPLGGKAAVRQHATSSSNGGIKRFRAYVLDRDFDYFLGKQLKHPNVFYLDRFCIENHVLEPSAVVELVIENHPKKKRAEVKAALSLDAQLPTLYRSARPLFTLFFCAQRLDLGVKNCSSPPEVFCKPGRLWELDDAAIIRYEAELKAAARAKVLDPPLVEPKSDTRLSRAARAPDYELVSGKFIAATLFHYVKSRYSLGSMTFESFVYRLTKNCDLRSMRPFGARVRAGAQAHASNSTVASRKGERRRRVVGQFEFPRP
jgi:hypothetical protein